MAAHNNAHATGAMPDSQDLRRRNVPSTEGTNGSVVKPTEPDEKKKLQQVIYTCVTVCRQLLMQMIAINFDTFNTRRIRVFTSPHHLHSTCFLYTDVEDRTVEYCYVG